MRQILVAILLCSLWSLAGQAKDIQPAVEQIGSTRFELESTGIVTVSGPRFSKPLKISADEAKTKIVQLIPIQNRMFLIDSFGHVQLLFLPKTRGFISRQMVRLLNVPVTENVFRGEWAEKYRWNLLVLFGTLNIRGEDRNIVKGYTIETPDGTDIILEPFENNFSVRTLLKEMDSSGPESGAGCRNFLNALLL